MSVQVSERETRAMRASEAMKEEHSQMLLVPLRDVRLMLISLWLGAAVFFSVAVAPSAFSVMRARHVLNANEMAGTLVTRTLSIVNTSGFIISLLLLASAFLFRGIIRRWAFYAEIISLALVAAATGIGQWIINARLLSLRLAMGQPIDEVDQNNPLRIAFNNLHGYSVMALGIAMIAAAVALLLIARRVKQRSAARD